MTKFTSLFLSLALIGASAAEAVLTLTPDNFDDVILKSGKPALVKYYADWCGHCKTLAPIYEELAEKFAFAKDKVTIAKVNADTHKDIGKKYGIQGFPTLKWFDGKSETPIDYKSGRDLDSLAGYISEKTGLKMRAAGKAPSHVEMLNDQKFNATIGKDKHVLAAFTAPWCGHCKTLAPIWEQLATDFANEPSVVIAKIDAESPDSKKTAKDQGVSSYPTIKFFPAGSSEPIAYEGGRTEDALLAYVNTQAGTYRAVGGGLTALAGTVASVDAVIQKIVDAGSDLVGKAEEIVKAAKAEKAPYAAYYGKVAEKLKVNGDWVEKELKRLEGILKKGTLAPEKVDDIVSRSNILRKFGFVKNEGKSEL